MDRKIDSVSARRFPFPIPFGWFQVAFPGDLEPGGVMPLTYWDRELVLYGTEALAPFNAAADYDALAETLIERSAHKLRSVCIIPVARAGMPRGNASDRQRPHQMPQIGRHPEGGRCTTH